MKSSKTAGRKSPTKKAPVKKTPAQEHLHYHKDGTLWAKGQMAGHVMTGYWEWFRKDGTRLRSGHFENGEQIGEWITYDKQGKVYKMTNIKAKKPKAKKGA
jgi:antitoxin component YwqK of YwqJK toxin-antitoxin module